jgi:hypothetical protein
MKKLILLLMTVFSVLANPDSPTHNFTIAFESTNEQAGLEYRVYLGNTLFSIISSNKEIFMPVDVPIIPYTLLTTNGVSYIRARLLEVPDGTNTFYVTVYNPLTMSESDPSEKLNVAGSLRTVQSTNPPPTNLVIP